MRRQDVALVERAKQGDVGAFERLAARYQDRIFSYLCRMCGDPSEAEDLCQEVFVRAFVSIGRFRGAATFQSWLYRIATNMCVDALRRRRRAEGPPVSLDEPSPGGTRELARELAGGDTPHDTAEVRELQDEVARAIQSLSEKLRPVVIMFDIQGLSYGEIAEALDCPLGTVKSRLFNARMQLRERLAKYVKHEQ
ncbi:MAG: sigma-70 family RNA polymerase sigma factor [Armatimonadota bacterium]